MLKVGIIGLGNIGMDAHHKAYLKIAAENGPVEVVAVCDEVQARLDEVADKNYRTYLSIDEMLEAEQGKLDYIDICLPTYLHAEIAIKAMEMGYNVLSEKPMALNPEQCQAMIDAQKKTGKLLMIAYCNRFYRGAQIVKSVIESGELGRPLYAEFRRMGGGGRPTGRNKNNWFWNKDLSGGAMLDLHIHDVDMIRWMFGMPNAVSVAATAGDDTPNVGYDIMSANYMYDNNMFVNAMCCWGGPARGEYDSRVIHVNFEHGFVRFERTKNRQAFVKSIQLPGKPTETVEYPDAIGFAAYEGEILYFCDCLKSGKKPVCDMPEESIDSVKMVMAEMESADKNGARIALK